MADVQIYKAVDGPDAFLLKAMLDGAGIRSEVRGEHLMGLAGAIPVTDAKPSVWVDASDEAEAKHVLARFRQPMADRPDWTCAHCGEENPSTFGACWSCGEPIELTVLEGGKSS